MSKTQFLDGIGTTTAPAKKAITFDASNINDIINSSANVISSISNVVAASKGNKTQQVVVPTQQAQQTSALQQQLLQQQMQQQTTGMSKSLKVGLIAVGGLAVVGIAYFMMKD